MWQRWQAVGNAASDWTGPRFETHISRFRDEYVTTRPINRQWAWSNFVILYLQALQIYAAECQAREINICNWRVDTQSEEISCPANSHYEGCATPCPDTCSNPDVSAKYVDLLLSFHQILFSHNLTQS